MQIENKKHCENFEFQLFVICSILPLKFAIFLKSSLRFNSFYCLLFIDHTLRLNNEKTKTIANAKIPLFVIWVKIIIYLS